MDKKKQQTNRGSPEKSAVEHILLKWRTESFKTLFFYFLNCVKTDSLYSSLGH